MVCMYVTSLDVCYEQVCINFHLSCVSFIRLTTEKIKCWMSHWHFKVIMYILISVAIKQI